MKKFQSRYNILTTQMVAYSVSVARLTSCLKLEVLSGTLKMRENENVGKENPPLQSSAAFSFRAFSVAPSPYTGCHVTEHTFIVQRCRVNDAGSEVRVWIQQGHLQSSAMEQQV